VGWNYYGQLGDGTTTQQITPELIISSGVQTIAAGYGHSLFLKADGSLWAMGWNYYGQLGDGTTTRRVFESMTPTAG
jgi:alpha-tubulin suppressor-like RCC1 family protein